MSLIADQVRAHRLATTVSLPTAPRLPTHTIYCPGWDTESLGARGRICAAPPVGNNGILFGIPIEKCRARIVA